VAFTGSREDLLRANLELRTASRVLAPIGQFHARALGELERKAALIDWPRWLAPETVVTVRVTSRKSRLYHQKAVAERIARATGAPVREAPAAPEDAGDDADPAAQLIVVRLLRDECRISLDSSGALLHRRGYRLATARAPMRETLAAALLLASGWDPATPLLDPFMGSGTIPIEAALLARHIPPGLGRQFALERWPAHDPAADAALRARLRAAILPAAPAPIHGSDRDAGALTAAAGNAERAGVAADLTLVQQPFSAVAPPRPAGMLVANPPYGVRLGETADLRDLYARLGRMAREQLAGWGITLLLPEAPLERATGESFRLLFRTSNGGLAARAVQRPGLVADQAQGAHGLGRC
jgi:putative N6-adenine-specific DNA methylase